jgi:hypothetical protein
LDGTAAPANASSPFLFARNFHQRRKWPAVSLKIGYLSQKATQLDDTGYAFVSSECHGQGEYAELGIITRPITAIGRIRLQVIPNAAAPTLLDMFDALVERGSNVVTDGLTCCSGLPGTRLAQSLRARDISLLKKKGAPR